MGFHTEQYLKNVIAQVDRSGEERNETRLILGVKVLKFKQVDFSLKWIWPFFEMKHNEKLRSGTAIEDCLQFYNSPVTSPLYFFSSSSSSLFLLLALPCFEQLLHWEQNWSHHFVGVSLVLNVSQELSWTFQPVEFKKQIYVVLNLQSGPQRFWFCKSPA